MKYKIISIALIVLGCLGLVVEHFLKIEIFRNITAVGHMELSELLLLIGLAVLIYNQIATDKATKSIQLLSFKRAFGFFITLTVAIGLADVAGSNFSMATSDYLYVPIVCCVIYLTSFFTGIYLSNSADTRNNINGLKSIGFYCLSIFVLFIITRLIH